MRCFCVLGPSQSGKTTLVEKLSTLEGPANTVTTPQGIDLSAFEFMGQSWCAIDTPGSNEALTHAVNALIASDACILCVSADPDEVVLAAPYLRAIERSQTPCILFVNKLDRPNGRLRDIVAALQNYTDHPLVLRQIPMREGDKIVGAVDLISERAWRYREQQPAALVEIPQDTVDREHELRNQLAEHLSEYDDWLLEELIEDRYPASDQLFSISARVLEENKIVPVLLGAASHQNGVLRLMKALRHEAPAPDILKGRLAAECGMEDADLKACGFHSFHQQNIGKTIFTRALSSDLKQGCQLAGASVGSLQNLNNGSENSAGEFQPGDVMVAVKSNHLPTPSLLTTDSGAAKPDWIHPPTPMFEFIIEPASDRDEVKLSEALAKIADTDCGVNVLQEEGTGAHLLQLQGPIHLRETLASLSDVFRVNAEEKPPNAVYRETISKSTQVHYRHRKQSGGAGQFADVKLSLRPNTRGAGFGFDDTVKGGAVPKNYIPAVEAGAVEALGKGPLGFPVLDVHVTLTDGQHHSVDSSEFAFRAAGRMGIQQALSDASPVLLQPIFQVDIQTPSVYSGDLVPVISSLKGRVLGFDRDESAVGWDIFRAMLPGSALGELARTLRSKTRGIGFFDKKFDHFEELYGKEAEAVVRANHA